MSGPEKEGAGAAHEPGGWWDMELLVWRPKGNGDELHGRYGSDRIPLPAGLLTPFLETDDGLRWAFPAGTEHQIATLDPMAGDRLSVHYFEGSAGSGSYRIAKHG